MLGSVRFPFDRQPYPQPELFLARAAFAFGRFGRLNGQIPAIFERSPFTRCINGTYVPVSVAVYPTHVHTATVAAIAFARAS